MKLLYLPIMFLVVLIIIGPFYNDWSLVISLFVASRFKNFNCIKVDSRRYANGGTRTEPAYLFMDMV